TEFRGLPTESDDFPEGIQANRSDRRPFVPFREVVARMSIFSDDLSLRRPSIYVYFQVCV
ncbi:MAG: hypothetical protein R3A10_22855, partial [Caldilineaceae bacterium]